MNTPKLPPLPEPDMYADPCDANGMPTEYYTEATVMRLLAAIAAQGVPDGWQLVPKKPTPEMLLAALAYHSSERYQAEVLSDEVSDDECYRAMLAAAPPAPQAAVVQQEPTSFLVRGKGSTHEWATAKSLDVLASPDEWEWVPQYTHPAQQAKPQPPDRWVVVRQTALDVGLGGDVRTGGRPELGYALIADAGTFGSEEEARAAHRAADLPLGWVVMHLSRLLPDLYSNAQAKPQPLSDIQKIAEALRKHGLALVKTASGYDVMKLGKCVADGIKE